jgi:hypothetical protein
METGLKSQDGMQVFDSELNFFPKLISVSGEIRRD